MTSPSLTLLFLGHTRLVRADVDTRTGEITDLRVANRPAQQSLTEAAQSALALGGKVNRPVWIFGEDFWIQSLSLNTSQLRGLDAEQIGRALAFEVEPFSGIFASEGALGFQPGEEIEGRRQYWVVEMLRSDCEAMQRAVRAAGGRLAGFLHPAGVPCPVEGGDDGDWQRLEIWAGGLVHVASVAGKPARTRVLTSPPPRGLLASTLHLEILHAAAPSATPAFAPDLPWKVFSLEQEAALRRWLQDWARILVTGTLPVPVIAPPVAPPSPHRQLLVGAVALLITILCCLAHATYTVTRRATLTKEQAIATSESQQLASVQTETAALQKEMETLEKQEEAIAQIFERRRTISVILRSIATSRPEDVVVRSIRPQGFSGLVVKGVSLESISSDEMSLIISENLRPLGWAAQPLQKTARRTMANGGPWEFAFEILPLQSESPQPPQSPLISDY